MYKKTKEINLEEGKFKSEFMFFEEADRPMFKKMFEDWVSLSKQSLLVGSTRIINIPEGLTEAIFALDLNCGRSTKNISGTSSSFDHYDFTNDKRIQLKAASSYGPSSFGPRSVYDEIYFMFLREIADSKKSKQRNFSGKYEIYKLEPSLFPNIVCKQATGETFEDQQRRGIRPRFIIPNQFIIPLNLKPILVNDILSW